jgi:hypothetical protein
MRVSEMSQDNAAFDRSGQAGVVHVTGAVPSPIGCRAAAAHFWMQRYLTLLYHRDIGYLFPSAYYGSRHLRRS